MKLRKKLYRMLYQKMERNSFHAGRMSMEIEVNARLDSAVARLQNKAMLPPFEGRFAMTRPKLHSLNRLKEMIPPPTKSCNGTSNALKVA